MGFAAGFAANRANTLNEDGSALTGTVGEPILGREAKLAAVSQKLARLRELMRERQQDSLRILSGWIDDKEKA